MPILAGMLFHAISNLSHLIGRPIACLLITGVLTALAGCDLPGRPAVASTPASIPDQARTTPVIAPRVQVLPPSRPRLAAPPINPVVLLAVTARPDPSQPETDGAEPSPAAADAVMDAAPEDTSGLVAPALIERLGERLLEHETPPEDDPDYASRVPVEESIVARPGFELLGEVIAPGTFAQLTWIATETFTSTAIPSAVLVANGTSPGPVLCITAAVHGDELNGIETVRRVLHELDPKRLSGTVIGVPIVNIQGFHRGSRYLPDRRDLNRFFPGSPTGSSASRIAHSLFYRIIIHCNALVDLHTGSFHRTNLPQLRANLNDPATLAITQGFGSTVILHSDGEEGTLRGAATSVGIPAVTLEAGGPMQVQEDAVAHSVRGIQTLLDTLGIYRRRSLFNNPEPIYYQSRWVRTDHGGILSGKVKLGRQVIEGDLLGTVIDPLTNQLQEIRSPFRGRVIGMALDQFVMPGYATFHLGIEAPVEEATDAPAEPEGDYEAAEFEQPDDPH